MCICNYIYFSVLRIWRQIHLSWSQKFLSQMNQMEEFWASEQTPTFPTSSSNCRSNCLQFFLVLILTVTSQLQMNIFLSLFPHVSTSDIVCLLPQAEDLACYLKPPTLPAFYSHVMLNFSLGYLCDFKQRASISWSINLQGNFWTPSM